MKIEKPKRYYKKVSNGDDLSLIFCYHHLSLIQKLLNFKDSDLAIVIGIPMHKLRKTMQMLEPLPERINNGMNALLLDRFGTANICWIALNTWANKDWGDPEVISEESEFSCRYIHPKNGFEVVCESSKGFHIAISDTETILDGTYGFSQVNPFFDVLDEMIKVDASQWVEFWANAQVARKLDLEQRIAARAASNAVSTVTTTPVNGEAGAKKKNEMSDVILAIEKEAMEGSADAKYSAGRALVLGIGIDKPDLEKAIYWLALASSEGHFQATKLLTKVKQTVFERNRTSN